MKQVTFSVEFELEDNATNTEALVDGYFEAVRDIFKGRNDVTKVSPCITVKPKLEEVK